MATPDIIALVSCLPLPAVLVDPRERVEVANVAATMLFGHDPTGRHYVTALRQPAALEVVQATLRDGLPREVRYLAREGRRDTIWRAQARTVPLRDGLRVLVTFEDLTPLEEAGQMRRDFVANVSHELRTPLTALLGFVETLAGPAKDDAAARERFLPVIAREARRMARLVDDLLSLSRVEAEERRQPQGRVDLCGIVRAAVAGLEGVADRAGVGIVLRLPEGGAIVQGDAAQLGQVVTNLVENAVKYGGAGSEAAEVVIAVTGPAEERGVAGPAWRMAVSDQGPGIAPHHLARLTERFYRVDDHRSREIGGTGLGLAIVKHILGRHRGRLLIESTEGKGSRFTAVIPAGVGLAGAPASA